MRTGEKMKVQIRNLKFRNQILLIFMMVFILIAAGSGLAFYHLAAVSSIETFSLSAESSLAHWKGITIEATKMKKITNEALER